MRVTKNATTRQCAICERRLLMGERVLRFAPYSGADYLDVCPLCQEVALEYGWIKEGAPTTPTVAPARKRRGLAALFAPRKVSQPAPVVAEPLLRRLSQTELGIVEAADLFNASPYRRTVEGLARSLGAPQASIVPLSGVNHELVVTIAWDLSWYQYRVSPDAPQAVRLAERGQELSELEDTYKAWNAEISADGRLVPEVALEDDLP
jgi:hypothetical protein